MVWEEFEAKTCFPRELVNEYAGETLVFMLNHALQNSLNFYFFQRH